MVLCFIELRKAEVPTAGDTQKKRSDDNAELGDDEEEVQMNVCRSKLTSNGSIVVELTADGDIAAPAYDHTEHPTVH